MTARIRLRRADYDNWDSSTTVLDHGEVGLVYDMVDADNTLVGFKVGNGDAVWDNLPMFRPPQVGTRTALGSDGDGGEGSGNAVLSWDEIAVLTMANSFTAMQTMLAGITVDESGLDAGDASVTIQNGNDAGGITIADTDTTITGSDVNIGTSTTSTDGGNLIVADNASGLGGTLEVAREIRLPAYDSANDRDGIVGNDVDEQPGGFFLDTNGPFLANGASLGNVKNTHGWGPNIRATTDVIQVGGYNLSGNGGLVAGDIATLRYAYPPASKLAELHDLDVPTKALVTRAFKFTSNMTAGTCSRIQYDGGEKTGSDTLLFNDTTNAHVGEYGVGDVITIYGSSCAGSNSDNWLTLVLTFGCTGSWIGIGQAIGYNQGGDSWQSSSGQHVFIKMTTESTVTCTTSTIINTDVHGEYCDVASVYDDDAEWDNTYRYYFIRVA